MKKIQLILLALYCPFFLLCQNNWEESGKVTSTSNQVGIGTNTPKHELHVVGDLVLGTDQFNKKFIFHSRTNGAGDFLHITSDNRSGNWDWYQGIILRRGGNVSIGSYKHDAKLTVGGSLQIIDGSEGSGKILTSDSNGKAIWQQPALPINPQNGTVVFYNIDGWQVLTPGSEGQVLTLSNGLPAWADSGNTSGPSLPSLKIGDEHEGGIIFYLDGNGGGLVCAPHNQSDNSFWGCEGTDIPDLINVQFNNGKPFISYDLVEYPTGPGAEIGDGDGNTQIIVNNCSSSGIAARLCDDLVLGGYNDWFLPSLGELTLMYENLAVAGLGNFERILDDGSSTLQRVEFWTSSEASTPSASDGGLAWSKNFGSVYMTNTSGSGHQSGVVTASWKERSENIGVRAVRKF